MLGASLAVDNAVDVASRTADAETTAHAAFNLLDKNGDGVISREEMAEAAQPAPLKSGPSLDFGEELDDSVLSQYDDDEQKEDHLSEAERETFRSKGFIRPDGSFRSWWEFTMVIFTLYCAFAIPIYIGWSITREEIGLWIYFEYLMDCCFMVDLILNFRTGIYDEEESRNVYDQKYIALNYIRGWFFIDLVSSTPLSFIDVEDTSAEDVDNVQIMRIFRLMRTWSRVVRMLKVLKMNQSIIDFQNNYEINPTYAKLLKGLIYSGVVTHLFSCGWYYCGRHGSELLHCESSNGTRVPYCDFNGHRWTRDSWLWHNKIPEHKFHIGDQYIAAMYWVMATITTVGYGDIAAKSPAERWYCVMTMAVGATLFAFACGSMTSIIINFDRDAYLTQRKLDALNAYMRNREITRNVRVKCREFCRHQWANTVFSENSVLAEMSPGLRMQVALEVNEHIVRSVPLFEPLRKQHLALICHKLRPMWVPAKEVVITCGDVGKDMYLIRKGVLDVLSEDGKTKYATLRQGAYFGEVAVITSQRRTAHVRARTICDLYTLSQRDFKSALIDYPEIIAQLRKKIESHRADNLNVNSQTDSELKGQVALNEADDCGHTEHMQDSSYTSYINMKMAGLHVDALDQLIVEVIAEQKMRGEHKTAWSMERDTLQHKIHMLQETVEKQNTAIVSFNAELGGESPRGRR